MIFSFLFGLFFHSFIVVVVSGGSSSSSPIIHDLDHSIENLKIEDERSNNPSKSSFSDSKLSSFNTLEQSSLSSPSSLSLLSSETKSSHKRNVEYGLYFDRISNLFSSLLFSALPMDLIMIIEGYRFDDKSLVEFYELVMEKLKIFEKEERDRLDFYSHEFVNQLVEILSLRQTIPYCDYLWPEMERLLFKWAIHMREFFAVVDNDESFEVALKSIKSVPIIIRQKGQLGFLDYSKLSSVKEFNSAASQQMMQYEIPENPWIFHLFASAIDEFYNKNDDTKDKDHEDDKRKIIKNRCTMLKTKYFQSNFNSNLLLRFMIMNHDPLGKMKSCILRDEYYQSHSHHHHHHSSTTFSMSDDLTEKKDSSETLSSSPSDSSSFKQVISLEYLEKLRSKGPKDLLTPKVDYTSSSMVEFFLATDRHFQIFNPHELVNLLRKLKRAGLLNSKPLENVIEFAFYDFGSWLFKWDRGKYKAKLKYKKDDITDEEYSEYSLLVP